MGWRSQPRKQEESAIEKYLRKKVEGVDGLCWKFVSPGTKGVPDRVLVYQGFTCFVELKRPIGGRVADMQRFQISKINERGGYAYVIKNKEEVNSFVKSLVKGEIPDREIYAP